MQKPGKPGKLNRLVSEGNMTHITLEVQGDDEEKKGWSFVKGVLPQYEAFWRHYVYPLRSEGSIYFRENLDPEFEYMAMCHYSVFINLYRAVRKITERTEDFKFVEEIYSHLHRAVEMAKETVNTFIKIYAECAGSKPKLSEAELETARVRLSVYRNLLHEPILATVKDGGRRLVPDPEAMKTSMLWSAIRKLPPENLIPVEQQLHADLRRTSSVLQDHWKKMVELAPDLLKNKQFLIRLKAGNNCVQTASVQSLPAASGTFWPER
jgi:hypothetical protein